MTDYLIVRRLSFVYITTKLFLDVANDYDTATPIKGKLRSFSSKSRP
jgi:hypothetical protein